MKQVVRILAIQWTLLLMAVVLFSIATVNAQLDTIGDQYSINQNVTLIQNCECSYVLFTKVYNPSNVVIVDNALALGNGTAFNHTIDGTLINEFGEYIVTGEGNLSTGLQTFSYTFEVTKGEGIFSLDLLSPVGILTLLVGAVLLVGLILSKQFLIMGGIVSIVGFILFINGVIWFVSIPIIIIGVGIVIVRKE